MEYELSTDDLDAQIEEKQRRIAAELRAIGRRLKAGARRHMLSTVPVVLGRVALLGAGVGILLFGVRAFRRVRRPALPGRTVGTRLARSIARDVEHRLDAGDGLEQAIAIALRSRTPITLHRRLLDVIPLPRRTIWVSLATLAALVLAARRRRAASLAPREQVADPGRVFAT